ncbi:hypothetical protein M409DRAFT_50486 [Zasmidium cellare ATCC 36951]|uniref:Protein kinase domain-containing protein n=1 Tax=Zasmidium cellare ATCC 36951 TaxID=1080233 RepID=A0A6A6D184_ZASCE|nr:uncharacterized protein M409DRAFT_50486 [Zasmidium cellare ATCC 36951]KAF2171859.1 hypothetical protein M409DRAFT_50486 [Zasmidium cellare ATCC 36951]
MAAYDIQRHFSGLRVQTARRRRDPFAETFDDDSEDEGRKSRTKTKAPAAAKTPATAPAKTSVASPFASLDALRDSDDDFLDVPTQKKRTDRRPSPAPAKLAAQRVIDGAGRRGSLPGALPSTDPKKAAVLAAGPLAYLDESSDDEPLVRLSRSDSPASRKGSNDPSARSQTPRGDTLAAKEQSPKNIIAPPKHTVASPFAGTKYLQDSDSDEEAVSSRKNSADSGNSPERKANSTNGEPSKHLDVKRVDKPKQNGSGVSWRAFSASRAEQRYAEVEALQASLRQRGRTISFCPHVTTDDGKRIPLSSTSERGPGPKGRARGKSPPRRAEDTKPHSDEVANRTGGGPVGIYNPVEFKTNPFTAISNDLDRSITASLTSASTISPSNDRELQTPVSPTSTSALTDSIESIAAKLTVSPQTIPESQRVDHSVYSPVLMSPTAEFDRDQLSRNSSTRSIRMPRPSRIPNSGSRRNSRRSTSANTSVSPAHAFLSNWAKAEAEEAAAEPKPDDEGQSIGLNNEYVIGRTINRGGFGVVKEVHSLEENGHRVVRAVKIVRRNIGGVNEADNDKAQQEVEHEVSIWRYLKHRHILSLHAVYETDFATFCVMDLNVGGTLFDLVRKCRQNASANNGRKGLPAHLAKSYAYQLACALRYLHEDIRVCHRDVKLENCLVDLTVPNADVEGGNLRLCDFGLADFLHSESIDETTAPDRYSEHLSLSTEIPVTTASSIIGTLEYASPKGLSVNRKLFETAGDVWAFGVIVYALCTGDLPFKHAMPSKTAELILRADWDETALREVAAGGGDVIDLVKGCLEKEIDIRFTISDALRSPWFEGCREESEESLRGNGWN